LIGTFSRKLAALPGLAALLGEEVVPVRSARQTRRAGVSAIVGWGQRPSTRKPRQWAATWGLPFIALEDGFLRSYGTGSTHPALSLVVDGEGIYYDATRPSGLETLLNSDANVLTGPGADYARARELILQHGLSKYNFAPDATSLPWPDATRPHVLVVDQTRGDASIQYGLADESTFASMLAAARRENPDAIIVVKTHPEVSAGRKQGHYADVRADAHTMLLHDAVNPASLVKRMTRVYVVTSHLGFEALLAGVPVTCFGMPWYAGWGATDDRLTCPRRIKNRSVVELFAAAYLHYSRYLNPTTHTRGTMFDVIDWLIRQREMAQRLTGRSIAIGYRRWKAEHVRPFLALDARQACFARHARHASGLHPGPQDRLIVWGAAPAPDVQALAERSGATLIRMEDGFIRSVGLGSDFVPPQSLVLDATGIYFDPRQPSDLETLLNTRAFTDEDRQRAAHLRAFIVKHAITKYNIEAPTAPTWQSRGKPVILVPGQVEDDASIRLGCENVRTNLALLAAVRAAHPDAFIVYKPHPDVAAGNRKGGVAHDAVRHIADVVETRAAITACINACDEVHTMTSLTGFDALLRGKPVTTWGRPFYAGWGLTTDRLPISRRTRTLTLDELVAGALLHYPVYRDATLNGFTTCEATLHAIVRRRAALQDALTLTPAQRLWHTLKRWARLDFLVKG